MFNHNKSIQKHAGSLAVLLLLSSSLCYLSTLQGVEFSTTLSSLIIKFIIEFLGEAFLAFRLIHDD